MCRYSLQEWNILHEVEQAHQAVMPWFMPLLQGWSAFAGEDIEARQFVCQYAGELLGTAEAALRLKQYDEKADGAGHALLVRFH